jgi:hypothetical protein
VNVGRRWFSILGACFAVMFLPTNAWAADETGTPTPTDAVSTAPADPAPVETVTSTATQTETVTATQTVTAAPAGPQTVELDADQFGFIAFVGAVITCAGMARLVIGLRR